MIYLFLSQCTLYILKLNISSFLGKIHLSLSIHPRKLLISKKSLNIRQFTLSLHISNTFTINIHLRSFKILINRIDQLIKSKTTFLCLSIRTHLHNLSDCLSGLILTFNTKIISFCTLNITIRLSSDLIQYHSKTLSNTRIVCRIRSSSRRSYTLNRRR